MTRRQIVLQIYVKSSRHTWVSSSYSSVLRLKSPTLTWVITDAKTRKWNFVSPPQFLLVSGSFDSYKPWKSLKMLIIKIWIFSVYLWRLLRIRQKTNLYFIRSWILVVFWQIRFKMISYVIFLISSDGFWICLRMMEKSKGY